MTRAQRSLGVTARSAQLNIDKLAHAGILQEATGQQRNRVYLAHEIVAIVDATQV